MSTEARMPEASPIVTIDSLDLEAQGVARQSNVEGGKVLFIRGALPTERVTYIITREKARYAKAKLNQIIKPAVYRTTPRCSYFGICGGCSMQHLDLAAQIAMKQRVLEDDLWHIGRMKPQEILRPIAGPAWHYRHRGRLSVIDRSIKKGTMLVGFHEHNSSYVADMTSCEVIPKRISDLLVPMRELIGSLTIRDRVPQIEFAVGEHPEQPNTSQIALVIRHLLPLTSTDLRHIEEFAKEHQVGIWLQAQGPETAKPFFPQSQELHYTLPEFGISLPFLPTDFTQVNHAVNQVLISKAISLLDIQAGERVIDLFCGIGNFTLPIATLAKEVLGIEGSKTLTQRAFHNARHNQLDHKTQFQQSNLFEVSASEIHGWGRADKWLIDPPREGAMEICKALIDLPNHQRPKRIVYVSCNPKTLARDAAILTHELPYTLTKAGIINMFPHTSHIESIAVFDLN
jgi:23S rRNA (uracil1939-C5)-methyltransferase